MKKSPESAPLPETGREPERLDWKTRLKIAREFGKFGLLAAGVVAVPAAHLYLFETTNSAPGTRHGVEADWRPGRREQVERVMDVVDSAADAVTGIFKAPLGEDRYVDFIISDEVDPDRYGAIGTPESLPELPPAEQGK